jgi:hypothetical protein
LKNTPGINWFRGRYYFHGQLLPVFEIALVFPLICFLPNSFSFVFYFIPPCPVEGLRSICFPCALCVHHPCLVQGLQLHYFLRVVHFVPYHLDLDLYLDLYLNLFLRVASPRCRHLHPDLFSHTMPPRLLECLCPDSSLAMFICCASLSFLNIQLLF